MTTATKETGEISVSIGLTKDAINRLQESMKAVPLTFTHINYDGRALEFWHGDVRLMRLPLPDADELPADETLTLAFGGTVQMPIETLQTAKSGVM